MEKKEFLLCGDDKYECSIGIVSDSGVGRRISGQFKLKRSDLFDSYIVSYADDILAPCIRFCLRVDQTLCHGIQIQVTWLLPSISSCSDFWP